MTTRGLTGDARCKRCGAEIIWLRHRNSQKLAPIDKEPRVGGNVGVDIEHGDYWIAPHQTPVDELGHTNHFATCPFAGTFRPGRVG